MKPNGIMLVRFLFAALALMNWFSGSPTIAAPAQLDLSAEQWKIQTGDDRSWSSPDTADHEWSSIHVGKDWEQQGFENYDGHAWYRLRFSVPLSWRERVDVQERQAFRLELGWIDDVDQTWFNGVSVGQTGQFPPNFQLAYREERKYVVPASLINWEGENVIAVRVYDGSGRGGMYSGTCLFTVADWNDLVTLKFDLSGEGGLYSEDDLANLEIKLRNQSNESLRGRLKWTLQTDEAKTISETEAEIELESTDELSVDNSFGIIAPGFYVANCQFISETHEFEISESVTIGYEPEKIVSPLTKEPDFDSFWDATLAELAEVDPEFELIRTASRDSETHEVFEVRMRSLGNVRVAGWYEKPRAAGRHSALLRVPGYSGNMQPTGRAETIAVFSLNIRGHGNSQEDVKGEPEDFWIRGLDSPRGYFYQGAYADCVRAIDFLASRPEVDQERIVVSGGSQGGGLSLATAALDSRIALCAPDIAFLCDWAKYFAVTDWPEVNNWIAAKEHRTWKSTLKTMSYFDMLNMADRIRCPVLFGIGLQDDVCPAATIFSVYNRINTEKEYRVYPDTKHWMPGSHQTEKMRWIHERFGTGE